MGSSDREAGSGTNRRKFIATVGIGATAALAGCAGGGDGQPADDGDTGGDGSSDDSPDGGASTPMDDDPEEFEMVMVTSDTATAAFAMSNAIASTVNPNTDRVFVDARPSEGTAANVGMLDRGEAQIGYIQNWSANEIREGNPPFDDLSFTPTQAFHFYDLPWIFGTANDGWESIMDIQPDSRVNPTPRGSGTAPALEHALENHAGLEYDRASFEFGELGGAMNEGRLDVGAVTLLNFVIEPGWLQEIKGTVDLRILGWPDDVVDSMQDDPALLIQDVDMTGFENYAFTPDVVPAPTFSYNFIVRHDMPYDALYAFLETMWDVREALQEDHAVLATHANGDFWVQNMYEGFPFHPAAADFYEEQGLWRDEFERFDG